MEYLIYLITGAIAGTLAGMLGVGGGLIIVPVLYFVFSHFAFESQQLMQIALATSLATIITTSLSSIYAHQKYHAINWQKVKQLAPSIVIAATLTGWFANQLASNYLKIFFSLFLFFVSVQMLRLKTPQKRRPLATNSLNKQAINNPHQDHLAGVVIGSLSALVGIGGGTLTVPYLSFCGFSLPKAIATSAACGLPISVAATLGYIIGGWQHISGAYLGFVYYPAWFFIAISSLLFAPLGAKLTHQLPIKTLKRIFALLLFTIAIKMIYSSI